MLGTDGVTTIVADRLRDGIPAKIVELRARLGRDTRTLPEPTAILDYEPGNVDLARWPFWYAQTVAQDPQPRTDEIAYGATVVGFLYTVRVVVWLRGPDHTAEPAMRTHLLAALETLAARPVLLDPDQQDNPWPGQGALLDPDSFRVRPGSPEPQRAKDSICAGYLECRVATVETLTVPTVEVVGASIAATLL